MDALGGFGFPGKKWSVDAGLGVAAGRVRARRLAGAVRTPHRVDQLVARIALGRGAAAAQRCATERQRVTA
jgi:hypothetical protein